MSDDTVTIPRKLFEALLEGAANKTLRRWRIVDVNPYEIVPHAPDDPLRSTGCCLKCGLKMDGVIGYCCPNHDCPVGLGPVTCKTSTTG